MVTIKRKPDFIPNMYEEEAWKQSQLICGIDEVGRSCFSGPVVAAAAILKPRATHELLKDSKLLRPKQRELVYEWLQENSSYGVGVVHHRYIDAHNIYQATLVAMKRALMQLFIKDSQRPSTIVVDAMPLRVEHLNIPVVYFVFGEQYSQSIAAASIIAKVTRDRLMTRIDSVTPGYAYSSNKGYGTVAHKTGIKEYGITVIHRKRFVQHLTKDMLTEPEQEVIFDE
mgnify:CR=1 FL=1